MKVNVSGRVEQLERKERKKGRGWKTLGRWKNWEREAGRQEGKTERGEQKERKERQRGEQKERKERLNEEEWGMRSE
ncbi:hypothetical protein Pmani_008751 [Petrolisthes manimaculis]|uniref:Uncharacterized protein n=1 Tax=Petrolisthes manimaculis TaxID=1843537 RepID=A0AAE1Q525_9EUCA|nr:hypothetical protein Pmani_008751 [Petrolisthes manimaculis]